MNGRRRPGSGSGVGDSLDAADSPAASAPRAALGERREAAAKRRRRRRRVLIATPFLVLLSWGIVSYAIWMLRPTSMQFGVRSVEWVRADVPFGNWLADHVEQIYYSANAPSKGGPQLKRLPAVGLAQSHSPVGSAKAPIHAAAWPPPIKPIFAHPLPGEGVWRPAGPPLDGGARVLLTTFRTELDYPQIVAYVAWFDHTRTAIAYYPGRYEPPEAAVRGPMMVPYSQRWRLLATFNAGFISYRRQ